MFAHYCATETHRRNMNDQVQHHAPHLGSADFQKTLDDASKAGKPVLVDFYAEWCGPCKLAAPIIDKLSGEMADTITIAKVDVDQNNDLSAKYGVMSIPTVIVFKDGEPMKVGGKELRQIGFPGEQGYRDMIAKATAGSGE